MPALQYPLSMRFKLIALAPRIFITDASGTERIFIHQKTWKLKEDIRIYNNSKKEKEIFRIKADRIIDFSANYRFFDSSTERELGSVKRKGMRSLWRATYYSDDAAGNHTHHLKEDNPWTKMWDALMSEVPVLNLFTGYMFNPSYTAYRGADRTDESQPVMKLVKKRAFWESRYEIQLLQENVSPDEELRLLFSLMLLVQLERRRG